MFFDNVAELSNSMYTYVQETEIFLIKHTEYYPPETVSSMMEVPRDRLVISIQAYIRDLFPVKSTEISFWPGHSKDI